MFITIFKSSTMKIAPSEIMCLMTYMYDSTCNFSRFVYMYVHFT